METFNVVDANGKKFSFTIDQLTDMDSGIFTKEVYNVHDSAKITKSTVDILDSDGNVFDVSNITDSELKGIKALDVVYEATHSGDNRNYAIYHSDSMEKDAQSWMSPFPKPFIKNHDIESEPMGRTVDFSFGQSELNQERDAISVTYRITDKEAIPKFLDGRYHTMSIGASVGHIKCNICGKDILKDGKVKFCGHWKGETYGTQKALWHARDLEYREGSVVNSPADDWAQVKKIVVIKEDEKKEGNKDNDDNEIFNDMDNAIGDNTNITNVNDDNNTQEPTIEDNQNQEPTTDGNNSDNNSNENPLIEKYKNHDFTSVDSLIELVTTLDANIDTNDSYLEDVQREHNNQINDLNAQITTLTSDKETLSSKNQTLQDEVKEVNNKFVKLAIMNKKLIVDKIVDFELINTGLEDRDERFTELMKLTSKELNDKYNSLDFKILVTRKQGTIPSPGIVSNNDDSVITDEEDNTKENDNSVTLKDIEESVINNIYR